MMRDLILRRFRMIVLDHIYDHITCYVDDGVSDRVEDRVSDRVDDIVGVRFSDAATAKITIQMKIDA